MRNNTEGTFYKLVSDIKSLLANAELTGPQGETLMKEVLSAIRRPVGEGDEELQKWLKEHYPNGYEFRYSADIKPGAEQGTFTDEQPLYGTEQMEQCLGTGVEFAADGTTPNGTFSMWGPKNKMSKKRISYTVLMVPVDGTSGGMKAELLASCIGHAAIRAKHAAKLAEDKEKKQYKVVSVFESDWMIPPDDPTDNAWLSLGLETPRLIDAVVGPRLNKKWWQFWK